MRRAVSLREMTVPRFALKKDEAAAAFGISVSTFDTWVREGRMPKGHKIGGVVLWDMQEISDSWSQLRDRDAEVDRDNEPNPFDQVVA